jgi:hypothetical protein
MFDTIQMHARLVWDVQGCSRMWGNDSNECGM